MLGSVSSTRIDDEGDAMALITATMRTLDLRAVQRTPIRGPHVWKLQAMLNVWLLSADEADPPPLLATDGIGGVATRAVLLDFQSAQGLAVDAIVGPLTWRALVEFDVVFHD